jgi:DNA-binding MarR family transcriptional regulator
MKNFTMFPNDLFRYTRADLIKPTHVTVYLIMVRFFNDGEGYAYPTVTDVSFEAGMSERTATDVIKRLTEVGLLVKKRTPKDGFHNNVYVPVTPIEDEEEFYAVFAGAREATVKRREEAEARNRRANAKQRNKPIEEAEQAKVHAVEPAQIRTPAATVIRASPPVSLKLNEKPTEIMPKDEGVIPIVDDGNDPYAILSTML